MFIENMAEFRVLAEQVASPSRSSLWMPKGIQWYAASAWRRGCESAQAARNGYLTSYEVEILDKEFPPS